VTRARRGWHFLQIPGPSNVPLRVLQAVERPTIDHRGPDFPHLTFDVLEGLKWVFGTKESVVIYPSSGTGAWEAALVNTLSPGDRIVAFETGQFAVEWAEVSRRLGLQVEVIPGDWRHGADPTRLSELLAADTDHSIKAVAVVHNETATGIVSRVPDIRAALDAVGHPALLLVDAISSLGCVEVLHDEWRVDVTISGSQKGMMLPPGLSFNAISAKAKEASKSAKLPRSYWDWERMFSWYDTGYFPYTPATNLLFGLREALEMMREEGLENIYRRHFHYGEATRRAAAVWGLEVQCLEPAEQSPVLTGIRMPEGHDADRFRKMTLQRFNMSLGAGLGRLKGKVFRIGHLGDFNDLMLFATLAGVESGLVLAGVPINRGGVDAAIQYMETAE
jgi:alanine-glyoxylate transaminase/serine-glyoxylate transaminase/serine-pyruvate transaminase